MYVEEIRRQAEAAPRAALPAVAAALWRAYGEGRISEAEAEALSGLIEARTPRRGDSPHGRGPIPTGSPVAGETMAQECQGGPRKPGAGSRPRTDASMERRRRWAASGRLPPQLAERFTLAEVAVLAVVAFEADRRGDCRLATDHLAALAGVSRSTVKATLRLARNLGFLTIEERRLTAWRSDTNVVRIASREWQAWMRLTRRSPSTGGGVKSSTPTNTKFPESQTPRAAETSQWAGGSGKASSTRPFREPLRFAASGVPAQHVVRTCVRTTNKARQA